MGNNTRPACDCPACRAYDSFTPTLEALCDRHDLACGDLVETNNALVMCLIKRVLTGHTTYTEENTVNLRNELHEALDLILGYVTNRLENKGEVVN